MRRKLYGIIALLSVILVVLSVVAIGISGKPDTTVQESTGDPAPSTGAATDPTAGATAAPTTQPTEPPIVKEHTATVGATGDILMHKKLIDSGYDKSTKTYNYDDIFAFFSDYVSGVDYAVANLEVTLCSDDNGYAYDGYPCFNCPDAIVDSLKTAGFDLLLTANNHAYDTRHKGFLRTQTVIRERELNYIGTREDPADANYTVVEVNGIRIGMVNYTYNTSQSADGTVALNGIPLTNADSQCINTFSYSQLDRFYEKLRSQMDAMYAEGAEAIVIYIHWGDEYQTKPNGHQTKIAQALCDMGIDVIVGNHAHVPQSMELLTSKTDENHKTACLYSTGNSVSNIYRGSFPINTEDGMLFQYTFAKYSDGTVVLEGVDILPTWVYRYDEGGVGKFKILTLDHTPEDWQSHMGLTDSQLAECRNSYQRTMDIVGEGLSDINAWCQSNQASVEAELGVASHD